MSISSLDKIKTPSVQSLLDSDLESVESLQCMNFELEELDEIEYALPTSDAPTLAEVLAEEGGKDGLEVSAQETSGCLALQEEFLQGVSQQLLQAQERSSTGMATSLSIGPNDKLTVGTAHGHLLSFQEQILRWVCNLNIDRGAVSCLSYNNNGDRILAGYARGLVCQYDSAKGVILRRVTLSGETWGILRMAWAGTTGLALDSGGSVWLLKFARPLGVRSAKCSCLFSGARGEVVAMAALDARVLALATLSRVIIVAGSQAAGVRLEGPPETLPTLTWSENESRTLICARARILQWFKVDINESKISITVIRRCELKCSALWLGWIGGILSIIDSDENLRPFGEDYDKPLDLSHIEPIYASAFFKGVWTDGRVSQALGAAGGAALGGVEARGGALLALGRRGAVRVRARHVPARARALLAAGHAARALALLAPPAHEDAAREIILDLADRPHLLEDKAVAGEVVKLCGRYNLQEELWEVVWERAGGGGAALAEAAGEALARGSAPLPRPDACGALLARLADTRPALLERVLAALPLHALDPHYAATLTRDRGMWRAYGAVIATIGGCVGAMRELVRHVSAACGARAGAACACAGDALLLAAADGLAGRGAAGRALPDHARPSARHDALQAVLATQTVGGESVSVLGVLARHDARSLVQLLRQCWRAPPFAGPLAKQNRLRVARDLLGTHHLQDDDIVDILEFIMDEVECGSIPNDVELCEACASRSAAGVDSAGSSAGRLARVLTRAARRLPAARRPAASAPRAAWRLAALQPRADRALHHFLAVADPAPEDVDDFFDYITTALEADGDVRGHLVDHLGSLAELRPRLTASIMRTHFSDSVASVLRSATVETEAAIADALLESGALRGEAALVHLERLCEGDPSAVTKHLMGFPGTVRPEEALEVVRKYKVIDAEPLCAEAAGDPAAAVELLARRLADTADDAERARLADEACAVCARTARGAPRDLVVQMWARVASAAPRLPPAALLDALRYLPADTLLARAAPALPVAADLLRAAALDAETWAAAARLVHCELHASTARARLYNGRAARGAARCSACGGGGALLVRQCAHAARTLHECCAPPSTCACCPRGGAPRALPARAPRPAPPPLAHDLRLIAPPRPDLEGIV